MGRLIDEGWFAEDDLYDLTDPSDPALAIWQVNYRPEVEAHDLLYDLFHNRAFSPFGFYIPELGLELAEHPSSPRFATAKLDHEFCLPRLAEEVATLTSWLKIDACRLRSAERPVRSSTAGR